MKNIWLATFALSAVLANATPVTTETGSMTLKTPEDLGFSCQAGVAPTGRNFPTASTISLGDMDFVVPDTGTNIVYENDPQLRLGNYCTQLHAELAAQLPATLTVTRTVTSENDWVNGDCVQVYVEEVEAKVGTFDLVGENSLNAGKVATSLCPP